MDDPERAHTDARGAEQTAASPNEDGTRSSGRRDIVVPMRLYKTITVFSTLIATLCILVGFILLDAATLQVSVLRRLFVSGAFAVGLPVDQELLSVLLGIAGLSLMALGAGVFVLSSRFRTAGMGNAQEDSSE